MSRTLILLLLLVAWLTAAGTAVRTVSRIWLRHWVERRLRGSVTAALYLERPQRLLLTAGAGVAIAVFVAGMLLVVFARGGITSTVLHMVGSALAVLLFGQLLPRAIARRWAPRLVPVLLPVLRALDLVLAPLLHGARALARVFARRPERTADEMARDDIEELLREGELEGVGEKDELAIITGVVNFGEKSVAEVMTPRADVFALDVALPPPELARRIVQSGYSRIPLYRGTIDEMVGLTHAFDVLKAGADAPPRLRPITRTPADRRCNDLLFEMLRKRLHLAIVTDAAGRTAGVVTLEDLLEELVGEIRDEHDEPDPATSSPAFGGTPVAGTRVVPDETRRPAPPRMPAQPEQRP